jgi:hypothetical protein
MNDSTLMARWSSRTLGSWLLGILASLVLGSLPGRTADAVGPAAINTPPWIALQDGKLTVHTRKAPLRQVMEEISRLSGVQVRWMEPNAGEQEVSVKLTDFPVSAVLRRVLRETNFILFYTGTGEGATLTHIWIASKGEGGEQPVLERQPDPPVEATPVAEEPAEDRAPPLDTVIQTAMSGQDLYSRLSAIESLGRHAQEDARIREILSDLTHTDSNPQVREIASAVLAGRE